MFEEAIILRLISMETKDGGGDVVLSLGKQGTAWKHLLQEKQCPLVEFRP